MGVKLWELHTLYISIDMASHIRVPCVYAAYVGGLLPATLINFFKFINVWLVGGIRDADRTGNGRRYWKKGTSPLWWHCWPFLDDDAMVTVTRFMLLSHWLPYIASWFIGFWHFSQLTVSHMDWLWQKLEGVALLNRNFFMLMYFFIQKWMKNTNKCFNIFLFISGSIEYI